MKLDTAKRSAQWSANKTGKVYLAIRARNGQWMSESEDWVKTHPGLYPESRERLRYEPQSQERGGLKGYIQVPLTLWAEIKQVLDARQFITNEEDEDNDYEVQTVLHNMEELEWLRYEQRTQEVK